MTRQKISTLAWITGIFIASLCVRLLLVGQKFCIEASDSVDYLNMAKHWAEGGTLFETFYTPGYPIAIALCHVFTGQWESAGRLASALLGTAAVLPAMGIARRVFSRKTAVLSGLIFSVYPALTEASTHVLSESTYVFFVLLALWAGLVAWQSSHKVLFLLAGAVSGMAYLVKPEGVLLFATLCGAGLIWTWKDRAWSTWVRTCVFLLAGFLIIASPYLFFLRSETGSWRLSGKTEGVLLWSQAVGSRNMVAAVDALHSQGDRPPARISPLAFAKRGIMNLHLFDKYILRDLFPSLVLVFVGFGLAAMPLTRPGLFLLSGILPSLALLFFNADARLLLPLSALGVLWSAHGISCVSVRIAEKIGPLRWIRPAVLGAVLFSLLPYTLRPYYRPDENRAYRQAGEWLKEHQKGSLAVMFRKPWVAYYAEATSVALPLGNAETVLEYGRTHGASHLVVDNRVIPNLRPELVHLQTSSCAPMGLDHLKTFQDPPTGTRVLIYRLSDPGAGSPGRTPP